jgi:uncharacterized protein (TIGR03435 family)
MRTAGAGLFVALALAYLLSGILPGAVRDPVFSRVWIERNTTDDVFYRTPDRTNGGLGLTAVTAAQLLQRAYPFEVYDIEGLPDWSWTERYDVRATSELPRPTPEERQVMVRAILEERFGLKVRVEPRELAAYAMMVAHPDGRLGPLLQQSSVDCVAVEARGRAIGTDLPMETDSRGRRLCVPWHNPGQLEGDLTMTALASWLREFVGRPVVDKTGLSGHYAVTLRVSRRRPAVDTIRDDLGLLLVPSRVVREILVVERFERPSGISFVTAAASTPVLEDPPSRNASNN